MNYSDLIFQKFNTLENRINALECRLFKLIAALEFIKSMELNSPSATTPKPTSNSLGYEETISQLFNI